MIELNIILKNIDYTSIIGNSDCLVDRPINLDINNKNSNALLWASDKYYEKLIKVKFGIIICSNIKDEDVQPNCTYIITPHPRRTFANILTNNFTIKEDREISETAVIHKSVIIGANPSIGNHVVIERNCIIGNNVSIDHNTTIKQGTIIKDLVKIGSNNVLGGIGFGYEKDKHGNFIQIPHIGNVEINDGAEIGNCTTIDRAVLGTTLVGKNVKIDNLVHIAHGVQIGENSLIIANSMIAGSVIIGRNCWVAPSSSILNKTTIGNDALIGMGAVVIKNVPENNTVMGNPAEDKDSIIAQRRFLRKNSFPK